MASPGWPAYLAVLGKAYEAKTFELCTTNTTQEQASRIRGYLDAYRDMGGVVSDIVSKAEELKQRDHTERDDRGGRTSRTFYATPYYTAAQRDGVPAGQ